MDSSTILFDSVSLKSQEHQQITIQQSQNALQQLPNKLQNCKTRPSNLQRVSLIKNSQISIQVKQICSDQQSSVQDKCKPYNGHSQSIEIFKQPNQDQNLKQNLFQGSNPGLFYLHKTDFDPQSKKSIQNATSLHNIQPRKNEENQQISQRRKPTDSLAQRASSKSVTTIIDPETEKQFQSTKFQFTKESTEQASHQVQEKISQKQKQETHQSVKLIDFYKFSQTAFNKSKSKSKASKPIYIPQKNVSNHRKHCPTSLRVQKAQKQFVVPIIINRASHNKSKYKQNQYLTIKDQNLTNFFTTKQKKSYLQNVSTQSTFANSNIFKSQTCPLPQNSKKQQSKFCINHSQTPNNFRSSICSNSSHKENCLNQLKNQLKDSQFSSLNIQNTKFLVKASPSKKQRKFFNQSISNLINYNYRPFTCRKKEVKIEIQQSDKQKMDINFSERKLKGSDSSFKENIPNQTDSKLNCDYWAQMNSYKKMRQNSKKDKKVSQVQVINPKLDNNQDMIKEIQPKEFYQKDNQNFEYRPLKNSSLLKQPNSCFSGSSFFQSQTQGKQSSLLLKQQSVSKLKNSRIHEIQMIRSNKIKRVKNFEKAVLSKLSTVSQMGVKLTNY